MYVDFTAGNKQYKLRLNTRNTIALEEKLGCNPLGIFGNGETLPPVATMVKILHASLQQFHHGITERDAMDIFDNYLEENTMTDFISVIVEIYKASGLIQTDEAGDEEAKN